MNKYFVGIALMAVILTVIPSLIQASLIRQEIEEELILLDEIESEIQRLSEMINARNKISELVKIGDSESILSSFNEDVLELENSYLEGASYSVINNKHQFIRYVYRDVNLVGELYLFYKSLHYYINQNVDMTKDSLELFTSSYPNSKKIRQALNLLTTIYLVRDQNLAYIELAEQHYGNFSSKQIYWLGQANYNIGRYEKAHEIFSTLSGDEKYDLRAKMMNGLIDYALFKTLRSIETFTELELSTRADTPYHSFLILTLGRLYAQSNDFENSLKYFEMYIQLNDGLISSDFAYEYAIVLKEAGKTDEALYFFNSIVNLSETSHLYDVALAQSAVIQSKNVDLPFAKNILDDAIATNKYYIELLNTQTTLLSKLKTDIDDYINSLTSKNRTKLDNIHQTLDRLKKTNEFALQSESIGVDQTEFEVIQFISKEYSLLLNTIVEIDNVAAVIATRPNDERVKRIEEQIADIDSTRVGVMTFIFLENMLAEEYPGWSNNIPSTLFYDKEYVLESLGEEFVEVYEVALSTAESIVDYENRLEVQRRTGNKQDFLRSTQLDTFEKLLNLLKSEAEINFGAIDPEDTYMVELSYELDAITNFRAELFELKDLVGRNFYQSVSRRLVDSNKKSLTETTDIFDLYKNRTDTFVYALYRSNQEYNYTLMDLFFQDTLKKDRQYDEMLRMVEKQEMERR